MEKALNQILDKLKTINQHVGNIENDVSGLKSDFSDLSSDVSDLKSDVSDLKSDVSGLKSDVSHLKSDVSDLKSDVSHLKSDVSDLKKDHLRLETRMENEVIDKLRALFDNREVQNDRFDRIECKLDDIATDTGYLATKVLQLRQLVK